MRLLANSTGEQDVELNAGPCIVCRRQIDRAHSSIRPTKAKACMRVMATLTLGFNGGHGKSQAMQCRPDRRWPVIIVTAVPRMILSKLSKVVWHFRPKWLYADRARLLGSRIMANTRSMPKSGDHPELGARLWWSPKLVDGLVQKTPRKNSSYG